ncbi:MAG: MgtC/SapB family protein [Ruminococcaceae bacterium]|nr:MgtC/SapB family protein [Oscillospiraceae bacterium]
MKEFLDFMRFTDGFHIWGVLLRLGLAVICGGIIGVEREHKRRPAGFRTHILICLGASMTTITSQYLMIYLGMFTDLARLGAQVIAGIGFIGAGTIIVTKRRQVKGLTTAAGLWTSAIVGLAVGAGYYEAALIATLIVLFVELVLSRFEYFIMSTARTIHLYIEYKENDSLVEMTEYLRSRHVGVSDLQITKSGAVTQNPCAIFSLDLPRKMTHDKLMTALSEIDGVVSVEEL